MNLMTASHQWANRPDDERFSTLEDLLAFTRRVDAGTHVTGIEPNHFRTDVHNGEIVVVGRQNVPAKLTHTAFSHLSQAVEFSPTELRKLADTPTLVSNILNNRLKAKGKNLDNWQLVSYQNGDIRARAFVSDKYGFISDSMLVERAMAQRGWRVPPARPARPDSKNVRLATEADVLQDRSSSFGLDIQVGDPIAPAGLYASWDDVFIFLVNENRRLNSGLARGVLISNNSVKARRCEITNFYYNAVCGNHIVWGATGVQRTRIIHIGERADAKARERLFEVFRSASDGSAIDDEARISSAKSKLLGINVEEAVETVQKIVDLSATTIEAGIQLASEHPEDHGDSSPLSVWGLVNGLTRFSQTKGFTDARTAIDTAAGKLLTEVC